MHLFAHADSTPHTEPLAVGAFAALGIISIISLGAAIAGLVILNKRYKAQSTGEAKEEGTE